MDTMDVLGLTRTPTAQRPLLGQTMLVVEDSRFACEAVRMMCLRSGARMRRADSLQTAQRHLAVYHPTVLLVDVGLPDGSGLDLIGAMAQAQPRIDVIIGTSGDSAMRDAVLEAGANAFLEKPVDSLLAFQSLILAHTPTDRQPPFPRAVTDEQISPDRIAYHDDLNHVAQVLADDGVSAGTIDYVTQFLGGVARSAQDYDLDKAVTDLARMRHAGRNPAGGIATLSRMVHSRIAAAGVI
ncbi:MAG: response regulator [Yoonia sp.]|uniref:response regulator n=1 Tax=Yoonia sp. TaxID=2212373 RepID=UPI003EF9E183